MLTASGLGKLFNDWSRSKAWIISFFEVAVAGEEFESLFDESLRT